MNTQVYRLMSTHDFIRNLCQSIYRRFLGSPSYVEIHLNLLVGQKFALNMWFKFTLNFRSVSRNKSNNIVNMRP